MRRTLLVNRVRRIVGQLLYTVLNQVVSPFLDFTGQIQRFGVRPEMLDAGFRISGCLVCAELFR